MTSQLGQIHSLQYYAIRHTLSRRKTTTIFLLNAHNIGRTDILLIIVMPERNHDGMFKGIENLVVVSFYELFKFILDLLFGQFL